MLSLSEILGPAAQQPQEALTLTREELVTLVGVSMFSFAQWQSIPGTIIKFEEAGFVAPAANDIVNFAAANNAPGLEGKYPFNQLLHSFEVHYPIRFPRFTTVG